MRSRTASAHSSGVPRVGPAGLPRCAFWAPLKAAAGQATTIKLQTNREFQCMDVADDFSHNAELIMSKQPDFPPPCTSPVPST